LVEREWQKPSKHIRGESLSFCSVKEGTIIISIKLSMTYNTCTKKCVAPNIIKIIPLHTDMKK
jgi:hypothetical protein